MQGFDFQTLGLLLFVATIVAMVTRRLRLPYSAGLVAAGIGLALLAPGRAPPLTPDLIYFVFLPPLVFDAAIGAAGMQYLSGWSWIGAALFGVLIAATDPVAVIAAFRQVKVPDRLHLLVEAESLLNDGVAAVGLAGLPGAAAGGAAGAGGIGLLLLAPAATPTS